jgi:hypothetical protein
LFGTDSSFFPRGWHAAVFEEQVKALYEIGLDATQAQRVLSANLERLFEPRAAMFRAPATAVQPI